MYKRFLDSVIIQTDVALSECSGDHRERFTAVLGCCTTPVTVSFQVPPFFPLHCLYV